MRRSLRLMKMYNYESPLKHLQQKREKRQLDEPPRQRPAKRQKLSLKQRRSSVIILNDENDFGVKTGTKKGKKEDLPDDSIIILDDLNESFAKKPKQNEDITVVWSSVPGSVEKKDEILPFQVDKIPNLTNLKMLKGDYPQKWLGDWLAEGKKRVRKSKTPAKKTLKTRKTKKASLVQSPAEKKSKKKSKTEPKKTEKISGKLREIIIDGPNVAKAYTKGKFFSEEGLKIVIDFFKNKGHAVKAFVPQHVRNRNRQILEDLDREGYIVFTPSRKAGSKVITPYDDRYILEYATKCEGIIISNDQFKDLYAEKPEWRGTIENRILPPTFVGDLLMFPEDPLGRNGPKLDTFLRHET